MYLAQKARNTLRALLQAHGSRDIKRYLWNREFSQGRWDCLERSFSDPVNHYVTKYANNGSILDLGCGSGSTGNELDEAKYRQYTGVDISDVAIEKARTRTEKSGRANRNSYVQSDIFNYLPTQQYDVILFKDSIYYVPWGKIKAMLERYSKYLTKDGVFIVRTWYASNKYKPIVDAIERNFEVVETRFFEQPMPEFQFDGAGMARGLNTPVAAELALLIIFRRGLESLELYHRDPQVADGGAPSLLPRSAMTPILLTATPL